MDSWETAPWASATDDLFELPPRAPDSLPQTDVAPEALGKVWGAASWAELSAALEGCLPGAGEAPLRSRRPQRELVVAALCRMAVLAKGEVPGAWASYRGQRTRHHRHRVRHHQYRVMRHPQKAYMLTVAVPAAFICKAGDTCLMRHLPGIYQAPTRHLLGTYQVPTRHSQAPNRHGTRLRRSICQEDL